MPYHDGRHTECSAHILAQTATFGVYIILTAYTRADACQSNKRILPTITKLIRKMDARAQNIRDCQ